MQLEGQRIPDAAADILERMLVLWRRDGMEALGGDEFTNLLSDLMDVFDTFTAPCEACKDKRYLICTISGSAYAPDGALAVQRCDECSAESLEDDEAAELARLDGVRTWTNGVHNFLPLNEQPGEVDFGEYMEV